MPRPDEAEGSWVNDYGFKSLSEAIKAEPENRLVADVVLKPVSVRTGVCNPTPRSWIR